MYIGAHAWYKNDGTSTLGYHVACCLTGGVEDAMHIDVEEVLDTIRRITIRQLVSPQVTSETN